MPRNIQICIDSKSPDISGSGKMCMCVCVCVVCVFRGGGYLLLKCVFFVYIFHEPKPFRVITIN